MKHDPVQPVARSAGLPGVLRLTGGLAILALAILAALVVLEVIPQQRLATYGGRILLLAVIAALAAAAIAALAGGNRRE
jgi:peptidoglycan/LPS O-acetylase OafA/YrhL